MRFRAPLRNSYSGGFLLEKIEYWKLKEDYVIKHSGVIYKKGRIFIQWTNQDNINNTRLYKTWIMATPIYPAIGSGFSHLLKELKRDEKVEKVDFFEICKYKDHWHKEFKNILNKKNNII